MTAISGDLWTVGGRQVRITSGTEMKDALQVGDLVKVHATLGTDGVLVAREVERADGDDMDDGDDDNSRQEPRSSQGSFDIATGS